MTFTHIVAALILGALQGITEFLPVSSSGHLIFFRDVLGFELENSLFFDVFLHLATLCVVLIYFRTDVARLFHGFVQSLKTFDVSQSAQRLSWLILIASLPAALFGFFFEDIVERYARNSGVVILMLILIGVLFLVVDRKNFQPKFELSFLRLRHVLIIGCAQALALIPGTSRSGITMIAGMTQGLSRRDAAKFSFLLSLPTVAGAGLKKLIESVMMGLSIEAWMLAIIGFFSAFIFGFLSVAFLMKFLERHSLHVFAWYRFILAFFIFIYLVRVFL
ncbi:MAG: undecaprenyl-diphosphatase UppP [Candidatus Kerfeldbacteria bacterium RIFCSPHIGHO2_02_FULL_42_14]|uniref:Undecaprenyl-diphosphatase n=1 Tax=Candidatus Kerfeldbacteria bacterium RIFCSPHIGHO2_02_FULL_42_14 TaxID=1798540 RepID=A0A1G2ARV1_9BACT|nr:MAG: undecaprenyl-diphosphatase UppP [Candidatus Kerfeldbacteria bacterium RIFCSPHIGHO2_02_FULL_42_14]OGY81316.1 MAG: undecaprenyl-diphosphatase UppP [Candidatus Kerfeldbacteria bacterium RIFCSPHIGHO2_12_FULL_42_13]OGY83590.1 MAG: undecaprenyl-diphosphatase UppP [Candidatus Kerfeldbacteria bacterium RIFCSPLOWO2_02_FULL_42_19]OGY86696.1 MAG: undecaprenyl-diphosphatase UppP [Candidatus Kerfeldbacteria bacterium RIFCSPLOWO2_12_FULL_43_9]